MSVQFSSWPNWRGEGDLFVGSKKESCTVRLPSIALVCHKRWKSLSFCEIWNNPTPPLLLIRPLTKKYCRAWSSMINLWIDSRTSQKYRILLSARQRHNSYFQKKFSKENILVNMMMSHRLFYMWKFFMIWFHKILKLFFRSSHRGLEIFVLNIDKNHIFSQFSWKFSCTLRTMTL